MIDRSLTDRSIRELTLDEVMAVGGGYDCPCKKPAPTPTPTPTPTPHK